jgi:hypothetical protein
MNKYYKQRNEYSCAVIAILNALVWAGVKSATYDKMYKKLIKDCKTDRDGTFDEDFERVLTKYAQKHNFIVKEVRAEWVTLIRYLKYDNCSIIVSHLDFDKQEWHYSFWHDYIQNHFYGANIECKTDIKAVNDLDMIDLIKKGYKKQNSTPQAWLIVKDLEYKDIDLGTEINSMIKYKHVQKKKVSKKKKKEK